MACMQPISGSPRDLVYKNPVYTYNYLFVANEHCDRFEAVR